MKRIVAVVAVLFFVHSSFMAGHLHQEQKAFEQLVMELDDPEYDIRERATLELIQRAEKQRQAQGRAGVARNPNSTLNKVIRRLVAGDLATDQAWRLRFVFEKVTETCDPATSVTEAALDAMLQRLEVLFAFLGQADRVLGTALLFQFNDASKRLVRRLMQGRVHDALSIFDELQATIDNLPLGLLGIPSKLLETHRLNLIKDEISEDSEPDGMPDLWEKMHDVAVAAADPDGDGLTNLEEYLKDTDPHLKDSDADGDNDGADRFPLENSRACIDVEPDDTFVALGREAAVSFPVGSSGSIAMDLSDHGFPPLPDVRQVGFAFRIFACEGTLRGPFRLTLPYGNLQLFGPQLDASELGLKLLQLGPTAWVDITRSVDTDKNTVSGESDALGTFAIAQSPEIEAIPTLSLFAWLLLGLLLGVAGLKLLKTGCTQGRDGAGIYL